MSEVNLNINEEVIVYLTKEGEEVLKKPEKENWLAYQNNYDDTDKVLKCELWMLMRVFGPELRMGTKPLFKNNNILVNELSLVVEVEDVLKEREMSLSN